MRHTPTPEPPRVMAVVLNYCSAEETLECVAALQAQDYESCDILVVDNGSPDGSGELLRRTLIEGEFIQATENTGYAGGNNLGIRVALERGSRYVFIVNPDVRVAPNCLTLLVEQLEAERRRAAAMPLQVTSMTDGTVDPRVITGLLEKAGLHEGDAWRERQWLSLPSLYGAALLLSCSALREVGLFDPIYFCYSEESDLCRRFRFHGFELGMVPSAVALHRRAYEHDAEAQDRTELREFLRIRNLFLFELKDPQRPIWKSVPAIRARAGQFLMRALLRRDLKAIVRVMRAFLSFCTLIPIGLRHRRIDRGLDDA